MSKWLPEMNRDFNHAIINEWVNNSKIELHAEKVHISVLVSMPVCTANIILDKQRTTVFKLARNNWIQQNIEVCRLIC